jgi:hypothetical protein
LIPPKKDIVTLQLEAFDVERRSWKDPVEVVLSISVDKFASGACRDAFLATGLKGLDGKFVVKRYRSEQVAELVEHFQSLDTHTRKVVQMHALLGTFHYCCVMVLLLNSAIHSSIPSCTMQR